MRVIQYLVFITSLLIANVVMAANTPESMLKSVSTEMLNRLQADQARIKANPNYVYTIVDRVLLPHVDFQEMSRRVLAMSWRTATPVQKASFIKEFSRLVVRTYSAALNAYTDQTVDILPRRISLGDNTVEIRSLIRQSGAAPIPVNYRLIQKQGDWKVYDMVIEGVSLVDSFRSQFADPIRQKGLDKVISDIAARNRKEAS